MLRHHSGLGDVLQALTLKVNDLQRETAGFRHDVRTLTHLVRRMQSDAGESAGADQGTEDDRQANPA